MSDPIFRTDDARWGLTGNGGAGTGANTAGTGGNLTAKQNDENHYAWLVRMRELEAKAAANVGFATDTVGPVTISGTILTFRFNDNSQDSVTLPLPEIGSVGDWAALTVYPALSFVRDPATSKVYIVRVAHTSAATFNPAATDGHGHDLYTLFFDPAFTLEGCTDVDFGTDITSAAFLRYNATGGFWYDGTADFSDLSGHFTPQQYPEGQQPLAQTVHVATDASLSIDLANGKYCSLTLDQTVTAFTITGWPVGTTAQGVGAELILTITNSGGHGFAALPANTRTVGGTIPAPTSLTDGSGVTRWKFTSDDGGATIYLEVLGLDYLPV